MPMTNGMYTSNTPEWETPQDLFDSLNHEFHLTLDIAASNENHKCPSYYTKDEDGLAHIDEWKGNIWCNPPYGRVIGDWVKACSEYDKGVAVMLLPARVDTRWWHDYIWSNPKVAEVRFIKGRLHFNNCKSAAPFPSCVVVFDYRRDKYAENPAQRLSSNRYADA